MANVKASFVFFKYSLVLLNIFYLIVGIILIAVAAAAKASAHFSSLSILGGIIASGVFLMAVAVLGLIGSVKHHQVALFFYMVFLGILFIILFSVSIAALALNSSQRHTLLHKAWRSSSMSTKQEIQRYFDCCGFDNKSVAANINITEALCVKNNTESPQCANSCSPTMWVLSCCSPCYDAWENRIEKFLRSAGGVGLFFSFTEVAGLVFTYYYRNRKDPTVNPRAFL